MQMDTKSILNEFESLPKFKDERIDYTQSSKEPVTINSLIELLKKIAHEPSLKPAKKGWLVKVHSQEEFDAVQKLLKKLRNK